ncbi:MAG: type II secretion system protein [Bacilli bacterium]|nr:type II secretion system GspH family protein [Bacilli bacterium]MDY4052801.1 type II secretion system protein [Bacilli bacterium]
MKKQKKEHGFTLVELLVVVAIMGIMGTLLVTNYSKYIDKSKQTLVNQQLNEIVKTFEVAFVEGETFKSKELKSFKNMELTNVDVTEAYKSLVPNGLPAGASLTLSGGKLTYTQDSRSAVYNYSL